MFPARPCLLPISKPHLFANASGIWRTASVKRTYCRNIHGLQRFRNEWGAAHRAGENHGGGPIMPFSGRYQSTSQSNQGPSHSKPVPSEPKRVALAAAPAEPPSPTSASVPANSVQPPAPSGKGGEKTAVDLGGDTVHKTNTEQRKADWRIIKNLAGNLWPRGWDAEARSTKTRVVLALGLLASGKVSVGGSQRKERTDLNSNWNAFTAVKRPSSYRIQRDHRHPQRRVLSKLDRLGDRREPNSQL